MWSCPVINEFDETISHLHDARLHGFLLDSDPKSLDLNFILYVQFFLDYNCEKYEIEKGFVVFENAMINQLSILNEKDGGQFYIIDIAVEQLSSGKFKFSFSFNDPSVSLILISDNMKITKSGRIETNDLQFLPTNWLKLLSE